jgi:hypothetical protein
MASWREIDLVRKDPQAAADIAKLALPASEFTDWELDFLRSIRRPPNVAEFTTRQAEKLLQIRDDIEEVTEVIGFSVRLLLKRVWRRASIYLSVMRSGCWRALRRVRRAFVANMSGDCCAARASSILLRRSTRKGAKPPR